MTDESLKEKYRVFWMIKGHLNASEDTIVDCYNGYFKRLWYDEETYYKEDGFEEAWNTLKLQK